VIYCNGSSMPVVVTRLTSCYGVLEFRATAFQDPLFMLVGELGRTEIIIAGIADRISGTVSLLSG